MMSSTRATVISLLLAVCTACSSTPTPTSSAPQADATLTVREVQVLRLATGGAGQGTLVFNGWQYPFEIENMALDGLGTGEVQFEGNVYNLDSIESFEGTYKPVAADVEADGDTRGFWFENDRGVRVNIITAGQDVTIRLNTGGSVVRLK